MTRSISLWVYRRVCRIKRRTLCGIYSRGRRADCSRGAKQRCLLWCAWYTGTRPWFRCGGYSTRPLLRCDGSTRLLLRCRGYAARRWLRCNGYVLTPWNRVRWLFDDTLISVRWVWVCVVHAHIACVPIVGSQEKHNGEAQEPRRGTYCMPSMLGRLGLAIFRERAHTNPMLRHRAATPLTNCTRGDVGTVPGDRQRGPARQNPRLEGS